MKKDNKTRVFACFIIRTKRNMIWNDFQKKYWVLNILHERLVLIIVWNITLTLPYFLKLWTMSHVSVKKCYMCRLTNCKPLNLFVHFHPSFHLDFLIIIALDTLARMVERVCDNESNCAIRWSNGYFFKMPTSRLVTCYVII